MIRRKRKRLTKSLENVEQNLICDDDSMNDEYPETVQETEDGESDESSCDYELEDEAINSDGRDVYSSSMRTFEKNRKQIKIIKYSHTMFTSWYLPEEKNYKGINPAPFPAVLYETLKDLFLMFFNLDHRELDVDFRAEFRSLGFLDAYNDDFNKKPFFKRLSSARKRGLDRNPTCQLGFGTRNFRIAQAARTEKTVRSFVHSHAENREKERELEADDC
ncbi:unnamed protein product [Caenorhabditis sp. 36 PRJEB53466]|nr:unnamed protein product [Caenorhabditis sp. 36 PRJEB53466]